MNSPRSFLQFLRYVSWQNCINHSSPVIREFNYQNINMREKYFISYKITCLYFQRAVQGMPLRTSGNPIGISGFYRLLPSKNRNEVKETIAWCKKKKTKAQQFFFHILYIVDCHFITVFFKCIMLKDLLIFLQYFV